MILPYMQDEESCRSHVSHMTSGPCLLLSVQRENAVKKLLNLIGPEDPKVARVKNCGYWRAIFGQNCVANGLYGGWTQNCICFVTSVLSDNMTSHKAHKAYFVAELCLWKNIIS